MFPGVTTMTTPHQSQRGTSLPELLVTVALIGIATLITAIALTRVSPPLDRATEMTLAHFQQVRSLALANTQAYRITPTDSRTLTVESATTCGAATWTALPDLTIEIPPEVSFASTAWQACFTSKGIASGVVTFPLSEDLGSGHYRSESLQLLLGGSVRRLP